VTRKRTKPPRLAPVTPGETSLLEMIALAQAGDTDTAREIVGDLGLIVAIAGSANKLPGAAAAYLARALADIAAGTDANEAFNLKSKGRPRKWPHEAKVLAVSIMNQFIERGLSIDDAAAEGSNAVNQYVAALADRLKVNPTDMDQVTSWRYFINRDPLDIESLEPMKSWYLELLNSKKPR
jgi:hypothetical protein